MFAGYGRALGHAPGRLRLGCPFGQASAVPAGQGWRLLLPLCELLHKCDRECRLLQIHCFTYSYFENAPSGHTLGVFACRF